jgi:hypothetical protein
MVAGEIASSTVAAKVSAALKIISHWNPLPRFMAPPCSHCSIS